MAPTLIDISRPISAEIAPWPGDTPFSQTTQMRLMDGDSVNLSTLTLSSHFSTHVDAPNHFSETGATIDAVELSTYWGPAQVVTVAKHVGPLLPDDFAHVDLSVAPRLLVRTAVGEQPFDRFPDAIPHPTPELADHLGAHGVLLYGTDTPSMDALNSQNLPSHHALLRNGIMILEGLDLRPAPDGVYELVALPLKIAGCDGSPVRAMLRTD